MSYICFLILYLYKLSLFQAPSLFVPFRKRLGTFSGSRYLAHDLPLPTDECEEELIERRRRACTNIAAQLPRHKAILRATTSLQAGQSYFNPVMRQSSSPNINNTFRYFDICIEKNIIHTHTRFWSGYVL